MRTNTNQSEGYVRLPQEKSYRSALIAIGANLPGYDAATPHAVCERAILTVCALVARDARPEGLTIQFRDEKTGKSGSFDTVHAAPVRSRWYSSAPVPPSGQPRYINGMLRVRTALGPEALLAALQEVERTEGRVRGERDAARTLDLDLIDLDGLIRQAPDPILPHPRAGIRAFVLLPLRDVAPDWVHPVTGVTVQSLIQALPVQDIRPLS